MTGTRTILIITSLTALIFLSACSSSSYSQRYNKPKAKAEKKASVNRFSSENDEFEVVSEKEAKKITERTSYNVEEKEFDVTPVEDVKVDLSSFKKKYKLTDKVGLPLTDRERLTMEIISYLETPYVYGGNNRSGIDCSAFTQNVMSKLNIHLPRTAKQQYREGKEISNMNELNYGDLVFFDTRKTAFPGHVGIYLGENLFVHASRSGGVTVSSLKSSYFNNRFISARRLHNFSN